MFFNSIKIALRALWTHKLRSTLTILGIVIGITSVIIVFSAGEGLKSLVLSQVESWGSDFVEVEVKAPSTSKTSSDNAISMSLGVNITTLKEADAQAVKNHPNISGVYSAVIGQAMVGQGEAAENLQLWGVTPDFINFGTFKVQAGRFFTDEENNSLTRVAVIGPELKEQFFGNSEALGQFLRVGKYNFKVVGIMEPKGSVMYLNMDKLIYLPVKPLQKLIMGIDHLAFIMGKLKDTSLAQATADDLTLLMRTRHNIADPNKDDFAVTTMEEMMATLNTVLGGLTLLLVAIAAVSLLVGGVGIMNIMLVAVTERTNEIGLRKAIGATPRRILIQFLLEAAVLTLIGGLLGIALGIAWSWLVALIANSQGLLWTFAVKPMSLVLAVGVAVTLGLIFGLYPASQAAKMEPVEALRYEY